MSSEPADPRVRRACERADERMMLIMDGDAEEQLIMASSASVIFAGTDLSGPDVLRTLANMVVNAKQKIIDGSPAEAEMRGVTLAAFFVGFFAKEEILNAPE